MKRLILMRHAAAMAADARGDRFRRLSEAGIAEAEAAGAAFAEFLPEAERRSLAVVCSDAERTKETASRVARRLGVPFLPDGSLYNAPAARLLERIEREDIDTLILVAHNPGVSDACRALLPDVAPRLPLGTAHSLWLRTGKDATATERFLTPAS
jgi:phosphohistidine phosphatase